MTITDSIHDRLADISNAAGRLAFRQEIGDLPQAFQSAVLDVLDDMAHKLVDLEKQLFGGIADEA